MLDKMHLISNSQQSIKRYDMDIHIDSELKLNFNILFAPRVLCLSPVLNFYPELFTTINTNQFQLP